jgi:hypothetical protein
MQAHLLPPFNATPLFHAVQTSGMSAAASYISSSSCCKRVLQTLNMQKHFIPMTISIPIRTKATSKL